VPPTQAPVLALRAIPTMVRSMMDLRSSSPKTPSICIIAYPDGDAVSNDSLMLRNDTFHFVSRSIMGPRSFRRRERRSTRNTMTSSNLPASASTSIRAKSGRLT